MRARTLPRFFHYKVLLILTAWAAETYILRSRRDSVVPVGPGEGNGGQLCSVPHRFGVGPSLPTVVSQAIVSVERRSMTRAPKGVARSICIPG